MLEKQEQPVQSICLGAFLEAHPCRLLMESICRIAEGVSHVSSWGFITEKQIAQVLSLASCFTKQQEKPKPERHCSNTRVGMSGFCSKHVSGLHGPK